jgi:hypothetical protein
MAPTPVPLKPPPPRSQPASLPPSSAPTRAPHPSPPQVLLIFDLNGAKQPTTPVLHR